MAPPCLVELTLAWYKDQLSWALGAGLTGCNCNNSSRQMEDMQHKGTIRKPRLRLQSTMKHSYTITEGFACVAKAGSLR